jgi:hypothetical protein
MIDVDLDNICISVNGWHTLKNLAMQQGTTVTFQYLTSLVKTRGVRSRPLPICLHLTLFCQVLDHTSTLYASNGS